ncbi:MAG: hypothetical protein M1814_005257 [Vezdaea aestivalis]|nr:MAG: hypothetical protein M1814_005257 [Vezdaea aestivalis]
MSAKPVIRRMKQEDIPVVTEIFCNGFDDDELFEYLEPGRYIHREHAYLSTLRMVHTQWNTPGFVGFVAVSSTPGEKAQFASNETKNINSRQDEIVGFAFWRRLGISDEAKKWKQDSLAKKVERYLWWIHDQYYRFAKLNKASDYAHIDEWDEYLVMMEGDIGQSDNDEGWYLDVLAVQKECRGKGFGGSLVEAGLDLAREEGLGATLDSSHKARGCYERCGFEVVQRREFRIGIQGWAMQWIAPDVAQITTPQAKS